MSDTTHVVAGLICEQDQIAAHGQSLSMPPVGLWDCSNAEYHADRSCVSRTALEEFRDSPFVYHGRYVTGKIPKRVPSKEMKLGTALHALLLEPHKFDDLIAIEPEVNGRTNEGKAIRQAFAAASLGKTIITAEQNELLPLMIKSILAHDDVKALLAMPHKREQAVVWVDPATGILCKCKPDIWAACLIADVKTASDPTSGPWSRAAGALGYHRQNAFYVDGCSAHAGEDHKMMHIVVGNNEESGFECCCYFLDELMRGDGYEPVALGRRQNAKALRDLAEFRRTDDWRAPRNRTVEIVNIPRYHYFED